MQYKTTSTSLGFSSVSEESCILKNSRRQKENQKDFVCKGIRSIVSKEEENIPVGIKDPCDSLISDFFTAFNGANRIGL